MRFEICFRGEKGKQATGVISRLEFSGKISTKNFALSDAVDNTDH